MADEDGTSQPLSYEGVELQNATPDNAWVSRPIAENITDAMEATPVGWLYDIVNSVLARRLKKLLDPESPVGALLTGSLVNTAINFRALNPNFLNTPIRTPAIAGNHGAGAGSYHSAVFGNVQDQRLPTTLPLPTPSLPFATGQDMQLEQNKGLLIAKLFWDLQHHIPCVLFNVVSKTYVPVGIGGQATGKRFFKDGKVITELVYKATLTVEATAVTEGDTDTSHLQAIVEACFGTLRDQVEFGAAVSGKSWQLMMPLRLTPSNITEIEAPWSQGDDKGAKLYTATVGLEDLMFEAISYVGRPMALMPAHDVASLSTALNISVPGETGDLTEPLVLRLGIPQKLIVSGAPVTSDLVVNQKKRVLEIQRPYAGSGFFQVIPRRTGEATIMLFETGMTVPANSSELATARTGAPLVQRKVVVTAV